MWVSLNRIFLTVNSSTRTKMCASKTGFFFRESTSRQVKRHKSTSKKMEYSAGHVELQKN